MTVGNWLLGIPDAEAIPESSRLAFDYPTAEVWVLASVVAALLVTAYVVGLYRREAPALGATRAVLLTALRVAAIAVVVLVLARPRLEWEVPQTPDNPDELEPEPPTVVFLIDESRSMDRIDADAGLPETAARALAERLGYSDSAVLAGRSRLELVREAFGAQAAALAERLRRGRNVAAVPNSDKPVNRLQVYAFAVEAREVYREDGRPAADRATGDSPSQTNTDTATRRSELEAQAARRSAQALRLVEVATLVDPRTGRNVSPQQLAEATDQATRAARDAFDARRGETNLGGALRAILADRSRRLTALVVVSDGRNNGLSARPAEAQARQSRIPIHTVAVGNPETEPSLKLMALDSSDSPRKGESFKLRYAVGHTGLAGGIVNFDLERRRIERDPATGAKLAAAAQDWSAVATTPEPLSLDGDLIQSGEVITRSDEIGEFEYRLTARVEGLNERDVSDNTRTIEVRILDDRPKVLMVSGSGGWEYRAIKNMLIRSQGLRVSVLCQAASADFGQEASPADVRDSDLPDMTILSLPRSREQLARYDAILLMDPAFTSNRIEDETSRDRRIDPRWVELVADLVQDQGLGLIYMAGLKNTAPLFDQRDPDAPDRLLFARLAELLPVLPEKFAMTLTRGASRGWPLRVTDFPGRGHPVMAFRTLANPQDAARENGLFAERLPRVYWAMPVREIKPSAQILALHGSPDTTESDQPLPLIAEQAAGIGRTLYFGFESTWRWRFLGDDVFGDFWRRAIKHVVEGRRLGGRRRVNLLTDGKPLRATGEPVEIIAELLDAKYAPLMRRSGKVPMSVVGPAGTGDGSSQPSTTIELREVAGRPGVYRGRFTPTAPGRYEAFVERPKTASPTPDNTGDQDTPLPTDEVTVAFEVGVPDREMRDLRADFTELQRLAAETGGSFRTIGQLAGLADAIKDKPVARPRVALQPPNPKLETRSLWNAPLWLILFAGLLGCEWTVRKLRNLA